MFWDEKAAGAARGAEGPTGTLKSLPPPIVSGPLPLTSQVASSGPALLKHEWPIG